MQQKLHRFQDGSTEEIEEEAMDPHNVLTGVKAVCPGAAEWVRRLRAERRGLRWLAIQFSDIGSALVELLGKDAFLGEIEGKDRRATASARGGRAL